MKMLMSSDLHMMTMIIKTSTISWMQLWSFMNQGRLKWRQWLMCHWANEAPLQLNATSQNDRTGKQQHNNGFQQESGAMGSQCGNKKPPKATSSKTNRSTSKPATLMLNLPRRKPVETALHCLSDEEGAATVLAPPDDHTGHCSPLDAIPVQNQNLWIPPTYGHVPGCFPMFQPPPWQWREEPQPDAETVSDVGGFDDGNDMTQERTNKSVIKSNQLSSLK